jgi:hypothetical protein
MNARSILFIVLVTLVGHFCYGQTKDESVFTNIDPLKSVQVFPSPATEFLSVKFETPIAKTAKFTVHNIIGNELEIEPEIMDEHQVRIKVREFHDGYYFLAIQSTGHKSTFKFLKRSGD